MYKAFGYSMYRTVLGYYANDENAYDMRKAMPRDKEKKSVIPMTRPVKPHELEFD
jgi:N-terminal acetyltransferase B complex catalytic subunit